MPSGSDVLSTFFVAGHPSYCETRSDTDTLVSMCVPTAAPPSTSTYLQYVDITSDSSALGNCAEQTTCDPLHPIPVQQQFRAISNTIATAVSGDCLRCQYLYFQRVCHEYSIDPYRDTLTERTFFGIVNLTRFWGDPPNMSAKTASLLVFAVL